MGGWSVSPTREEGRSIVKGALFTRVAALGLGLCLAAPGATAQAANGAEILTSGSSVPGSMNAGSTAPVRVRVRNTGTTTWTAGTLYRLGALPSGSFNQVSWSGFPCGGYMNGPTNGRVFLCSNVPPGATYDFNFNVTVPGGTSGSIRFAVRMVRDGVAWFGQAHAFTISVGGPSLPDVVIQSLAVSPANPNTGQGVTFSAVVKNIGTAPTPSDKVIGVGYRIDGPQVTWGVVNGPLAPGASVTVGTRSGGAWTATAGTHTLTAVVDDVNRFPESNENNNAKSISFAVGPSGLPDVVIDSLAVSPPNPKTGQGVTFSAVVRNIGSAPTPSGQVIGVGYRIDGPQVTWGVVNGPLAPGASVTVGTRSGGAWTATAGAHTLTAVVDDVNRFAESNENNNARSFSFHVSDDTGMPPGCPSTLDFPAIRSQLNQQGQDLAFVKIGFHVGPGGNQTGLGKWMECLDAAGVPFFLKSVDAAGSILEAAQLRAASGVPHVLVYRKSVGGGINWDVPDYNKTPLDAATEHWNSFLNAFPPELDPYRHLIWIETINEVDKNRAEWLGEFAFHTAQMAMANGFNWAAFGWSSGEPEREHWEGPQMRNFLSFAADNPDRVAVALHEYSYVRENLDRFFPYLVGRFQFLFDVCDDYGIARPKVLVTEFGWVYDHIANSVSQAMGVDLPWAAELYAGFPEVLGAAIWYLGPGFGGIANEAQKLIEPLTTYALQNYFVIPLENNAALAGSSGPGFKPSISLQAVAGESAVGQYQKTFVTEMESSK